MMTSSVIVSLFLLLMMFTGIRRVAGNEAACFQNSITKTYDCGTQITYKIGEKTVTGPSYYRKGIHFVIPFITGVDSFQINRNDLGTRFVKVNIGTENQEATVFYKAIVQLPVEGVITPDGRFISGGEYTNYKIGAFGSADIEKIVTSRMDAAFQVGFAPIDPATLSTERTRISKEVSQKISAELSEIGVKVIYLQVTNAKMNPAWQEAAKVRISAKAEKEAAKDKGDAVIIAAKKHAKALDEKQNADVNYATAMTAAYGGNGLAAAFADAWRHGAGPIAIGSGIVVTQK